MGSSPLTPCGAPLPRPCGVASEPLEKGRYVEASAEALRLGVKDSLGYGVTSALTGYLDLGAGVLILW